MTDLAFDWGGAAVSEVYPRRVPDLVIGRPVTLVGRWSGDVPRAVKVTGKVGGERREMEAAVAEAPGAELAAVWARMKIADLGDRLAAEPGDVGAAKGVRDVALEYGLVSSFTSFVMVDSLSRPGGGAGEAAVRE
jgi:Ca-activated chloride channel family protein